MSIIKNLLVVRELYSHINSEVVQDHSDASDNSVREIYIKLTDEMEVWLNENIYTDRYLFDTDDQVEVDEMHRKWRTETAIGQYAGQEIEEGEWILGCVNRDASKIHIELIKSRSAADIMPILYRILKPGTIIYSDALSTYKQLDSSYNHFEINKRKDGFRRFEELEDGTILRVHVNNIENRWRWLRQLGRDKHTFDSKYVRRLCVEYVYRFYNEHFFDLLKTA